MQLLITLTFVTLIGWMVAEPGGPIELGAVEGPGLPGEQVEGPTGPEGPVKGPEGPVQEPEGPVQEPEGPVQGPKGPVQGPQGPEGPVEGPEGLEGPVEGPEGPSRGTRSTSQRGRLADRIRDVLPSCGRVYRILCQP